MKRWTLDFDKFNSPIQLREAQDDWVLWWLDWLLLYLASGMSMLEDQLETRVLAYCAMFYRETRAEAKTKQTQVVGEYVGQYAKNAAGVSQTDLLFTNMGKDVDKAYGGVLKGELERLAEGCHEMYQMACYETQWWNGGWKGVRDLTEEQLAEISNAKWFDGQRFSDRLWNDKLALERSLRRVLIQGINLGWDANRMAFELRKTLTQARYVLERLIRTEANRVQNAALLRAYKNNGVEKYQYVAILDDRTSEVCEELNGREFPLSEAEPGVNMPPMHPNCRSSTIPLVRGDLEIDRKNLKLDYENWLKEFLK